MTNGCVCCTLQGDLVDQIIQMATKGDFNYMIIEASGISEPSEIAKLFRKCDEDHDHKAVHSKGENVNADKVQLSDVARLDTCVTVIDAPDFFNKLDSIRSKIKNDDTSSWSKLMVEQIEFSNIIIINKTDLVAPSQIEKIKNYLSILHPNAIVISAEQSVVDVDKVVNTKLHKAEEFNNIFSKVVFEFEGGKEVKSCCKSSKQRGEPPCCRKARTIDSGLSQVMLASKKLETTRHEARFGITSFLYKARRPFHTLRIHQDFLDKYFMFMTPSEEEECGESEEETESEMRNENEMDTTQDGNEDSLDQEKEEEEAEISKKQEEANVKAQLRTNDLGNILQSKGFMWTTNTHDDIISYGQAGNVAVMGFEEEQWKVLNSKAWIGSEEDKTEFRKGFVEPWGDRRQELVIIGHNMKHEAIQKTLDACLLTDEEFALGVDGWKATINYEFS